MSRVVRLRFKFIGRDGRGWYVWRAELPHGGGHFTVKANPTWFWARWSN